MRLIKDRFAARVAREYGENVLLKGVVVLELRLAEARSTLVMMIFPSIIAARSAALASQTLASQTLAPRRAERRRAGTRFFENARRGSSSSPTRSLRGRAVP